MTLRLRPPRSHRETYAVIVRRVGADHEHRVELDTDDAADYDRLLGAVDVAVRSVVGDGKDGDSRRTGLRVVR